MSMIYDDPNPNCPRAFSSMAKEYFATCNMIHMMNMTWTDIRKKQKSDFWVLDHVPGLRSFSGLMESTATSPFKIWRSKAVGISIAEL